MGDFDATIERRPPRWNILAICTPLVAFVVGIIVGELYGGHPVSMYVVGVRVYGAVSLLGAIFSVIALVRRERWWGISWLALAVNGLGLLIGLIGLAADVWNPPSWAA